MIIKTIVNPLSIQTELKAGTIDMAAEKTLPNDSYADLRDEWIKSGEGAVLSRQDNWRYIRFQFDPAYARPIELSQDVRLRRGLLLGWDRGALRELTFPGFDRSLTNGDTFMQISDPRATIAGEPYAAFPYDSTRAAQELASGGWIRATDGRLLNQDGKQVQLEIRATPADAKEMAVVAEGWRRLGAEVNEYGPPEALNRENAFKSQFPATNMTAQGSGDGIFVGFDGRQSAVAETNWIGNNRGHYLNPALDRLIEQLSATVDITEQAGILRQKADILVADLPALPAYFRLSSTSVRNTVRGPIYEDFPATQGSGNTIARNAHLWDKA